MIQQEGRAEIKECSARLVMGVGHVNYGPFLSDPSHIRKPPVFSKNTAVLSKVARAGERYHNNNRAVIMLKWSGAETAKKDTDINCSSPLGRGEEEKKEMMGKGLTAPDQDIFLFQSLGRVEEPGTYCLSHIDLALIKFDWCPYKSERLEPTEGHASVIHTHREKVM